jgi:hypothetical protein
MIHPAKGFLSHSVLNQHNQEVAVLIPCTSEVWARRGMNNLLLKLDPFQSAEPTPVIHAAWADPDWDWE